MASGVQTTAVPGSSGVVVVAGTIEGKKSVQTYWGLSLRETAGAVAVARIREASATGRILDVVSFAANESAREWYGPQGEAVNGDIYFEKVSGTIEGVVRHG